MTKSWLLYWPEARYLRYLSQIASAMRALLLSLTLCFVGLTVVGQYDSTHYAFLTKDQHADLLEIMGDSDPYPELSEDPYVQEIKRFIEEHSYVDQVDIAVIEYPELKKLVPKSMQGYIWEPMYVVFRMKDGQPVGAASGIDTKEKKGSQMLLPGATEPYTASPKQYSFFFRDAELVYSTMRYTNATRMGSCGTIHIEHVAYFKDETFYKGSIGQQLDCYGEELDPNTLLDQSEFMVYLFELWSEERR